MSVFDALINQAFLQKALLAGVLASIGCGLVGPYVVVKRIGYLAGGIAHAVLGAVGVALYFGMNPLVGALVGAIVMALIVGWVSQRLRGQEDMVIAALWAGGMATGVVLMAQIPGYQVSLKSYLFGNILLVTANDLWLMAGLDAVLGLLVIAFYRQFMAVCFDEEFARLRGLRVTVFYLLLLCLVALTIVLLIQVVGLILVIALLSLPAAAASLWTRSLAGMMMVATLFGLVANAGGLALAYEPDLPAGSVIVLVTVALYAAAMAARRVHDWRLAR
jgi:zinc transport system permease protein